MSETAGFALWLSVAGSVEVLLGPMARFPVVWGEELS
jgi:hypothetical protein